MNRFVENDLLPCCFPGFLWWIVGVYTHRRGLHGNAVTVGIAHAAMQEVLAAVASVGRYQAVPETLMVQGNERGSIKYLKSVSLYYGVEFDLSCLLYYISNGSGLS